MKDKNQHTDSTSNTEPIPERGSYIFGLRPIMEAIEAGKELEKVYLFKDAQGELYRQLSVMLSQHNIRVQYVPVERLNRITQRNHQGVIAVTASISYASLEEVVEQTIEKGEVPLVVLLDGVTDVRNFGAIVRSAECAGAHAVVMPAKGAAPINADSIKTSAGAMHLVPVCRTNNLRTAIFYLKDSGFQIVAASEKASEYLYSVDYRKPTAIIMGAEDVGISKSILDLADEVVKIPIQGKIASLNVSAAASLFLFEAVRQRIGK